MSATRIGISHSSSRFRCRLSSDSDHLSYFRLTRESLETITDRTVRTNRSFH